MVSREIVDAYAEELWKKSRRWGEARPETNKQITWPSYHARRHPLLLAAAMRFGNARYKFQAIDCLENCAGTSEARKKIFDTAIETAKQYLPPIMQEPRRDMLAWPGKRASTYAEITGQEWHSFLEEVLYARENGVYPD